MIEYKINLEGTKQYSLGNLTLEHCILMYSLYNAPTPVNDGSFITLKLNDD